MKLLKIGISIILICCLISAKPYKRTISRKPNIVYILVDQWRAQATGYAGDKNAHTPNLDLLAEQSVNVKNAVSGLPVCSPHRASLLSGQYPLTHGVFLNDVLLDTNGVTLGKVLAKNGYTTGIIGKWHVDGHGRKSYIPPTRQQGFEYWKVLECAHDYNQSLYFEGSSDERKMWDGYDVIAQADDAMNYIREKSKQDKPFALIVSMGPPHSPYQTAPEKYRKMYENKEIILRGNIPADKRELAIETLRGYYSHITAIDDNIGKLWQTLKDSGIDENTIIIFTADHGDLLGSHGAWDKQQPYEESIRVPFLIHYPAVLGKTAQTSDILLNTPDIMPTLLGLTGLSIPKSVEGVDFSKVLKGERKSQVEETIISCVHPFGQWSRDKGGKEYRGIVTQRYTYTRDLNGPWLLFDNKEDPFQLNNLIGNINYKNTQADLDKRMNKLLKKQRDSFRPSPEYIRKWKYVVDETGTVPHRNKINYEGKPIIED